MNPSTTNQPMPLEERFAYIRAHAAGDVEGIFGPKSMAWMIFRERAILLSLTSAVVMEIAHPALAAAGHRHSSYRTDLWGRARRTLNALHTVVFGDLETAFTVVARIHNIHSRIRGTVRSDANSPWAGKTYQAQHPELMRWVWATLINPVYASYSLLVRPLSPAEKAQFYEEWKLAAVLVGIPLNLIPQTLDDYQVYYQAMLTGDTLELDASSKAMLSYLAQNAPIPERIHRVLLAGWLAPRWRQTLELPWTPFTQWQFNLLIGTSRAVGKWMPPRLRYVPAYHQALTRMESTAMTNDQTTLIPHLNLR